MTLPQSPSNEMPARPDLAALAINRNANTRRRGRLHGIRLRQFFVVAFLGVVGAAWAWHRYAPLMVETAIVTNVYPSQALTLLNATGYVVAQRKASVASKASGRLEWLGVIEGSKVHAGEVIARLENRDTEAMRDQAAANVQLAEANLGQGQAELSEAEQIFTRSEALVAKKLVSDSAHDSTVARLSKAQAALEGYKAAIAVARANLRLSEITLDQTLIRAPFDGVVITRNANLGDTITPFSQSVDAKGAVVTIADLDTLEVEADVAETSYLTIGVGQPAEIQLDALTNQRFEGAVSQIVPTVDRAKASTLVKIKFLRPDPRMLPEMSAKVSFLKRAVTETERKPFLALPAAAVIGADGSQQVYVVDDGRARLHHVELGMKLGDQFEVRGLDAGTRVVLRPPETLTDGRAVKQEAK